MSTSYTFAQNESISPRQLYRLYVFNLLGVGTLVLPNNLAKLGKYAFIWIFPRRSFLFCLIATFHKIHLLIYEY